MKGKISIKDEMNLYGNERIPFFFMIDFELMKPVIYRLSSIDSSEICYNINGLKNVEDPPINTRQIVLDAKPEKFEYYLKKFEKVYSELHSGNSYLVNLTCKTPVELNSSLKEIFLQSSAKYKVWFRNEFVCYSPETFVQISDGQISSFPMKGTIDASVENAEQAILNDPKETAEHYTIVDLIRNDLSIVSANVSVPRFRFIDTVESAGRKLLQVSSEIRGDLPENYLSNLGDIIYTLLPAGSVSGAPKRKTIEIIQNVETELRGYYTGICGIFDGVTLDSGVMIRYLENINGSYFYRSGGGITSFSNARMEYNEMVSKIYVPTV